MAVEALTGEGAPAKTPPLVKGWNARTNRAFLLAGEFAGCI